MNTFRMLTNQCYSPTHRAIGDTLSSFLFWIIQLCIESFREEENSVWINFIKGGTYIMIYFGIFIFLELIIIMRCGMDKNTTDMIINRVDVEEEEINKIQDLQLDYEILSQTIETYN